MKRASAAMVAVLLLLVASLVLLTVPVLSEQALHAMDGLDAYKYLLMGQQGPQADVAAPFRYRVLFPWIAHWANMEPLGFYRLVSLSSLLLMALAAMRLGQALGISLTYVAAAMAMTMVTAVVKLCASSGYVTDLPLMAAATWMALFLLRQQHGRAACLAAIMVANRELSFLLLTPLLWTLFQAWRQGQLSASRALGRAALWTLPALLVLLGIRYGVGEPAQHFSLWQAIHSAPFPHLSYWTGLTGRLGGWLFPLSLLAMSWRVPAAKPLIQLFMGSALIALMQTLLGTDTARLGATVLPLALMLSAAAMERMALPAPALLGLLAVQYLSFVMDLTDPVLFEGFRQVIYLKYALASLSMACLFAAMAWSAWRFRLSSN